MNKDTDKFLSLILPPRNWLEGLKSIVTSNCIILGGPGTGKTNTVRWLTEQAHARYGMENCNCVLSKQYIAPLFSYINNKKFQLLAVDDYKNCKDNTEEINNFFDIRNIANSKGMKTGYILTIEVVHSFISLPKDYREYFDYLILTSCPENKYHKDLLGQYIDKNILKSFARIQLRKKLNPAYNAYNLYYTSGGITGMLKTSIPKNLKIKKVTLYEGLLGEINRDLAISDNDYDKELNDEEESLYHDEDDYEAEEER